MERVTSTLAMGICCSLRKHKQGLCINLEGWNGEEKGREAQQGGDTTCPPTADSC